MNLAEYYAGQGGAEDLDWRDRRQIASQGGNLRYDDPSQLDDRYLRQVTDYWGGTASVPSGKGKMVTLDNPSVGVGGYRTIKNPAYAYGQDVRRAMEVADYMSQFLPPERLRDEVLKQTGVDIGNEVQTPNQRDRAKFTMDLESKRLDFKKRYADLALTAGEESPAERAQVAYSMGVPIATDVTKGLTRSSAERIRASQLKESDKRISDAASEASKLDAVAREAQQFMALNERTASGPFVGSGPVAFARSMSSDVSTMRSITDRLTPAMRQGLPGAASDKDVAMFRSATVGIDKPYEANLNIASALVQRANLEKDRVRFLESYRDANPHNPTGGAERAWREYLDANPIFDTGSPESQASFKLNDQRLKWDEYFRLRTEAAIEQRRRQRRK